MNERYRRHTATGSFAMVTEGEITWWDTFGSRNEVVAPPRRRPRATAVRRTGDGTKGTQDR
ncbi:hypothetical protein [Streptomyces griseorubiginosus]|uniref:hypothetical protein n=1 Tax=Streptomyces griseorubiginosus TaxID=67304 RepID=UPI002E7FBD4B|nr:hypothetical protein [Streptomyces griseorubiginosus]WUB44850.1 hypothetical protein OHN19_16485 [Streptomyces griseorubiginosus]WUB53367.1 hypothetical protein OG942_16480 [Streptomyces griseorubiginosus]